ncbi:MAG: hypothetical protein PVSMB11_02940 [Desulfuromonadaceae bacterium]
MNDSFKIAMQLTMVDMLSGAASVARRNILNMGAAGKEVQRDFDLMTHHISRGLKLIAVVNFGINKLKPGIADAAELQDNLIDVRMSLMRSGKDAATLNRELAEVRATAVDLQKITPFSASDVVQVQKELLNSGLDFNEVVGKGATRAAMMLATITKSAPEAASAAMLNIGIPYHLKSSEYGEVADVIQRHVMSGRMKLPDLNAGLPYVAGVAKNFKVPWDDLLTGMAVLGEQGQLGSMAGTHLKDFYSRLTGTSRISRRVMNAVNQDLIRKGKAPLEFWDKKGEMKSTPELINSLRSSMGSYNTHQKMFILEKIFGDQGGLAALALMSQGTGSWEFVKNKAHEVAGSVEKLNTRLTGFSANTTALAGTMKSTAATMFDPWLGPLTAITKSANDAVDAVGKLAQEHPDITTGVNGVAAVGLATVAGYGLFNLVKGGLALKRVLPAILGNLGGTSLGIAEGKAVQAATGVPSVFVTNWPGGFGGAGINGISNVAAAAAAGGATGGAVGGAAAAIAAAGAVAIPIVAASAMAYFSRKVGENLAEKEAKWRSIPDLKKLRMQHMVMGGGENSFQVQTIDKELKRWGHDQGVWQRTLDANGVQPPKNDIKLYLNIDSAGRIFSHSDAMNTNANIGGRRGSFFDALMTTGAV